MRNSTVTQTVVVTPSSNRRQSARQARTSSNRPNYYARPFAGRGSALGVADNGPSNNSAPGFFPAITHFTDSAAALPKEVMRQFSMLKEVEAKIHGPDEEIKNLADAISKLPTPPRRHSFSLPEISPGMTANTSANASISGSVHNGATPMYHQQSGGFDQQDSHARSSDEQAALQRAQLFYRLSWVIHHMNPILDEKIAVLSNANRILTTQLDRMESSYPYIEDEISEEARLGSLTHWAYADKEAKKTAANDRTRRDVAAANNLAAAAAAMHEGDIAASRSEARREAMLANKRSRNQHVDSDFDNRPAKRPLANRTRKPVEPAMAADLRAVGLGITNGAVQPNKRRKTEKNGAAAPAMERSISGVLGNGGRAGGASPRETPATENGRKRTKAAPVPAPLRKRSQMASAQSPTLTSSPPIGTFTTARDSITRPHISRVRQNSVISSVHPIPQDNARNRPSLATSTRPMNGMLQGATEIHPLAASSVHTIVTDDAPLPIADVTSLPSTDPSHLKREETEVQDNPMHDVDAPTTTIITRAGRASKTATPMTSSFPTDIPMVRSRSTRNNGGGGSHRHSHASSESAVPAPTTVTTTTTATAQKRSHKKGAGLAAQAAALAAARSRRGVDAGGIAGEESDIDPVVGGGGGEGSNPGLSEDEGAEPETEDELEGGEGDADADAEGEDRYCYCNQVSYGEMVGCDNDDCPIGWFHLACVGLKSAPKSAQWFCNECREGMGVRKSRPVSRH